MPEISDISASTSDAVFRALAVIVVIGGLARLADVAQDGGGDYFPLAMEIGVTPLLALWRERVERRLADAAAGR